MSIYRQPLAFAFSPFKQANKGTCRRMGLSVAPSYSSSNSPYATGYISIFLPATSTSNEAKLKWGLNIDVQTLYFFHSCTSGKNSKYKFKNKLLWGVFWKSHKAIQFAFEKYLQMKWNTNTGKRSWLTSWYSMGKEHWTVVPYQERWKVRLVELKFRKTRI